MLNLNSYSGKQLQTFIALINQFKQGGVIDTRIVKEQINKHLNTLFVKNEAIAIKTKHQQVKYLKSCPECGKSVLEPLVVSKEKIVICKKCRYSEYIGDTNGR